MPSWSYSSLSIVAPILAPNSITDWVRRFVICITCTWLVGWLGLKTFIIRHCHTNSVDNASKSATVLRTFIKVPRRLLYLLPMHLVFKPYNKPTYHIELFLLANDVKMDNLWQFLSRFGGGAGITHSREYFSSQIPIHWEDIYAF